MCQKFKAYNNVFPLQQGQGQPSSGLTIDTPYLALMVFCEFEFWSESNFCHSCAVHNIVIFDQGPFSVSSSEYAHAVLGQSQGRSLQWPGLWLAEHSLSLLRASDRKQAQVIRGPTGSMIITPLHKYTYPDSAPQLDMHTFFAHKKLFCLYYLVPHLVKTKRKSEMLKKILSDCSWN